MNFFVLFVLVVVFVKFTQEGIRGRYDSLEENFTLEEDVEFFSIEVGCTSYILFFKGRVSTLMQEYQTGRNGVPQQVKLLVSKEQSGLIGLCFCQGT